MSLRDLLNPAIAVAERLRPGDPAELFWAEHAIVAGAVPARRREFAAGRACVREALAILGHAPVPILADSARRPIWPPGLRGSLTHCDGYAAAALAPTATAAGIGIDAEPVRPLDAAVADLILDADEQAAAARLERTHPAVPWSLVIFSAKESVFKAQSPTWLDPTDIHVAPHPDGTFVATLSTATLTGRWSCSPAVLCTAVVLPPG